MITVYVWDFLGSKQAEPGRSAWGHASADIAGKHISWWPQEDNRRYKVGQIYSVPHVHPQSYEDDKRGEGLGGPPKSPDHTIYLDGLDEQRVLDWWAVYGREGNTWSTLRQNCSTTIGRALMIGGGDDFATGLAGWWHSWNMVWQPADVLRYSRAIEQGLLSMASRRFAVLFIRRFVRSPLGLTSLTLTMDENSLATSLFEEHGSEAKRVEEVFRELDENRNADADDVAELYVRLLQQRGGPPLDAVRQSTDLRARLIKVLEEGWTSAGEQQCIKFLRGLG